MSKSKVADIFAQIGSPKDLARRRMMIQRRKNAGLVINGHVALLPESEARPAEKRTLKRASRSRMLNIALGLKEEMSASDFAAREGITHAYAEKILKKAGKFKLVRFRAGQSPAEMSAFQLKTKMTVKEFAKLHKISASHAGRLLDRYGKRLFESHHRCKMSGTLAAKQLKEPMTTKAFAKQYGLSESYARRCLVAVGMRKGAK